MFGIYPICYWWVSGGYLQPEPTMYSRFFHWFPGPLTPSDKCDNQGAGMEVVDTCWQLVGVVGTGLYHSMANVQMTVG